MSGTVMSSAGRIEPGRLFDRDVSLDGCRAMNERDSIKVLVKP